MSETRRISKLIAPVYYQLHGFIRARKFDFINLPGGRGSGKSSFVSIEIVLGVMRDTTGNSNAIVLRAVSATLRESVYAQIAWAIDMLGVSHLWDASIYPLAYTYRPTGAQILFRGLDDPLKLKSIRPRKGRFAFAWFEEFNEISCGDVVRSAQQSLIRGEGDFTIFRSFNPAISASHWANVFLKETSDERTVTLLTNYTQIPREWLGEAFIREARRIKNLNPRIFEHEYMGIPTGSGGEVFPNIVARTITDEEIAAFDDMFQGVDFGFSRDPCCWILAAYDPRREQVLVIDEIYERGISNRELAEKIKARQAALFGDFFSDTLNCSVIFCDAAEPKSIRDLRDQGLQARPAYKAAGCVVYRTRWMQHRKIVIDPKRTPNAYREFSQYEFLRDRSGVLLSQLPDRDNHAIDATAYALTPRIYSAYSPA